MPRVRTVQRFAILFLLYFALWWLANLPATSHAWLSTDDFDFARDYRWWHNYGHGRPLGNLVMASLSWDTGANGELANILFRTLQGAVHAATAVMAAALLYKSTRLRVALIAPAIFLLWPYNGEAAVWRAAGNFPLSAFVSVTGALFVYHSLAAGRRWLAPLGMVMVASAVLMQQLGAMAGLLLWAIMLVVQRAAPQRRELIGAAWLGAGYACGALASKAVTRAFLGDTPGRDQLATDLWGKVAYLRYLWAEVLWSRFSPLQQGLQLFLLGLLIVAFALHLIRVAEPPTAKLIRAAALAAVFTFPYAPMLITVNSPDTMRVLYLAPFLLVAAAIAAAPWLERVLPHAGVVLTGALLVIYLPLAYVNSGDFVRLYNADVQFLEKLSTEAAAAGRDAPAKVAVAYLDYYFRAYDPHGVIRMLNGEAKLSAFLNSWAGRALIEWRTDLIPVTDNAVLKKCGTACTAVREAGNVSPFLILPMDDGADYCVCP